MVNNFFKQHKQTDNCNFIGDADTPKIVYKVHVRGNKEIIVRLMNDIINVPDRDQISVADDETRIIRELDV